MSTATIGSLRGVLGLDTAQWDAGWTAAQKQMRDAGRSMQRLGGQIATIGAGFTATLTAPLIAAGFAASKAATEAADAMGQVDAAIQSMGNAAGRTRDQLGDLAEGLMRNSLYDDDEILRQVTANLLTFGNVAGAQFDRAQQAAVNLATRMKTDLQSATLLVGKALNDPIKGMTAMGRAGIQFTAAQKAVIKSMVEAGNVAGAQAIILGELERQFGGAAAAAQNTDPYDRMRDSLNSVTESAGAIVNKFLVPFLDSAAGLLDRFNALNPAVQEFAVIGAGLAAALGPALVAIGAVVGAVGALVASPMAPFILGASAAVAGLTAAFAIWGKELTPIVQTFGDALVDAIGPMIPPMVAAMTSAFEAMAPVVKFVGEAFVGALGPIAITLLRTLAANVTAAFDIIGQAFRVVGAVLRGDWSTAWNAAGSLVLSVVRGIGSIVEAVFPGITQTVKRMVEGVTGWLTGTLFKVLRDVIGRVKGVSDAFFKLYDAVVGHSYIPDMVDGIAEHMGRLQSVMVDPATRATALTTARFEKMGQDVRAVIDGLLTDRERLDLDFASDTAALDAALRRGDLSATEHAEWSRRNRDRYVAARDALPPHLTGPMARAGGGFFEGFEAIASRMSEVTASARDAMGEALEGVDRVGARIRAMRDDFADAFADGLDAALRGDWTSVLRIMFGDVLRDSFRNLGGQVFDWLGLGRAGGSGGGWGNVISSLFGSLPKLARGGTQLPSGMSGADSQLMAFWKSPAERVDVYRPGQDMGPGGVARVIVEVNDDRFNAYVDGRAQPVAAAAGSAAIQGAREAAPRDAAKTNRYTLARR